MTSLLARVGLLLTVGGVVGCVDVPSQVLGPELWPDPQATLPEARFFDERPWLKEVSSWSSTGCGEGQPSEARFMGDFSVGNGHVFALTGYACPLNTLHGMAGPDYQQESAFFKDTWHQLAEGAEKVLEGRVFRVRRTAILISSERSSTLGLYTITFAPWGKDAADPVNRSILRVVILKNLSSERQSAPALQIVSGPVTRAGRERSVVVMQPEAGGDAASIELGDLEPGEERVAVYAFVASTSDEERDATVAALRGTNVDALLEATRERWFALMDRSARLESPDDRVNDLLESVMVTIRCQQTFLGGVSPMSRYSLMWIRDTAGVVRFLLRIGLFEEARAMLDYYHLAAVVQGDIANALDLDHQPAAPPPEPDWASMPPFSGRARGEGPSYLPLMAGWYSMATGDGSLVDAQYEFLRRALLAQNISADDLIPFSGDETYRVAMSIALGQSVWQDYVDCCLSANSSFLYVAAAEALAREAEARDRAEDAATLRARAAAVRKRAEETYWSDEGYYAPLIFHDDPRDLPPPFEDVSTKPLWCGYAGPDDERALTNLKSVITRLGRDDGFLQSPLGPGYTNYLNLEISEGVYTGMMPGYYLTNLALVDHPLAERAFNAIGLTASPSGAFAEYHIYDDYSPLQAVYDSSGVIGDMTARHRPWEGAICMDALVLYLTGLEPDAAAGAVALAPRLPNRWPRMKWSKLRVGEERFDLVVEELRGRRRVTISPTTQGALEVRLSIPLGKEIVDSVRVNDTELQPGEYTSWGPFDGVRVRLPPKKIDRANPLTAVVEHHAGS